METTDSIFCETAKQLEEVAADRNRWLEYLAGVYGQATQQSASSSDLVCPVIFDRFHHLLENVILSDVGAAVNAPVVQSRMVDRLSDKLFSSAGCVLTYWLVENHFNETKRSWPDESLLPGLQLVCADLGVSYE